MNILYLAGCGGDWATWRGLDAEGGWFKKDAKKITETP